MGMLFLFCDNCEENMEVYCDGHNAMMCQQCRDIDCFSEPMCETCRVVPLTKEYTEDCEECLINKAESMAEQQFTSFWEGNYISPQERQRKAQTVK